MSGHRAIRRLSGRRCRSLVMLHLLIVPGFTEMDSNGRSPDHALRTQLPDILQPSPTDNQDTLQDLDGDVLVVQQTIASSSGHQVSMAQQDLGTATLKCQQCRNFFNSHTSFAKGWAASSFRRTTKQARLDWALVQVEVDRLGKNVICSSQSSVVYR